MYIVLVLCISILNLYELQNKQQKMPSSSSRRRQSRVRRLQLVEESEEMEEEISSATRRPAVWSAAAPSCSSVNSAGAGGGEEPMPNAGDFISLQEEERNSQVEDDDGAVQTEFAGFKVGDKVFNKPFKYHAHVIRFGGPEDFANEGKVRVEYEHGFRGEKGKRQRWCDPQDLEAVRCSPRKYARKSSNQSNRSHQHENGVECRSWWISLESRRLSLPRMNEGGKSCRRQRERVLKRSSLESFSESTRQRRAACQFLRG